MALASCEDPENIHRMTPFGSFFYQLRDSLSEELLDISHGEANPFYKPEFVSYLLRYFLPYTPLLTHIMSPFMEGDFREDHQNPVEMWHRILKHEEQGTRQKLLKIGRYIQQSREMLEGE
jgi:hypothetical protein